MSTALVKKILTPDDKARALALAADGNPWSDVLNAVGMTQLYFWRAMRQDPKFTEDYASARVAGLHMRSDDLLTAHKDCVDLLGVKEQELYSKNLQWLLARRLRSEYGDQLHVTSEERPNARKVLDAIDAGLGAIVVTTVSELASPASVLVSEESEDERARRLYGWML